MRLWKWGGIVLTLVLALALAGCPGEEDPNGGNVADTSESDEGEQSPDTDEESDGGPEFPVGDLKATVESDLKEGNAPLSVSLNCATEGDNGAPLYYKWEFGVGTPSSSQTLDFTYHVSGDYNVCCEAWRQDGLGNVAEACQLIRVKDSAELSVTSPKINSAAELGPGQSVDVTFNVRNVGGKINDPFDVRCVLSPVPNQNWEDAPDLHSTVFNHTQDGMDEGQFVTAELNFVNEQMTVPADTEDGDYFLLCKADADDVVNEQNKGDNAKFATTFITVDSTLGQLPDIAVTSLTIPDQKFPKNWGEQLSYNFAIENLGEGESEGFKYKVEICNGDFEECSVINTLTIFSGMEPGEEVTPTLSWTVPETTPDGNYCLRVTADTEGTVNEENKDNNVLESETCFEVKFFQLEGVDLVLESLECKPKDAVWNGTLAAKVKVTNTGNVASGAWSYEVFLSTQAAPTPTTSWDLCKKNCADVPGLAPGESYETTAVVTIPGDMPLTDYFCIVKVDNTDELDELDEGNNFAINDGKIQVLAKAYTDVFVDGVTFAPAQQEAGQELKVTYTLGNNDVSTAAGVKVCVVLSTDNKTSATDAKSKDIILGSRIQDELTSGFSQVYTDKYELPLALHHTIGSYYVGVVADCDNLLKDDTQKSNNWDISGTEVVVISPQGGCFEDSFEPNGTQELAPEISAGDTGGIGVCNDDDWFSVQVPQGDTLIVDMKCEPTLSLDPVPHDIDMELYDSKGVFVDSSAKAGDSDQVLAFVVPATELYSIRLTPKKGGNEAQCTLDVQLKPPVDGIDLFPAKVKASPTTTFAGGALYLNWKLINLGTEAAGPFDVAVYMSMDDELSEEDKKVGTISVTGLAGASAVDRSDFLILPTNIDGGTWTVILSADDKNTLEEADETNNLAASAPIVIDGENPCVDDLEVFEPNNTLEEAAGLLPETATFVGLGVCPDLDDYYKLPLKKGQRLDALVDYDYASAKGFLYLQLLDKNGDVLDEGTSSSKTDIELPWVWDEGIYFLRVYNPKKSNKFKPYTYDLTVTLSDGDPKDECETDQFETNNGWANATAVGCGLKNMRLCRQDQDWLTFTLPSQSQVVLTLENDGDKVRMDVYTDPTGKEVAKITKNGELTVTNPADIATLFYVKVSPKTASTQLTDFDYTIFFDGIAGVDLEILSVEALTGAVYQGEDELVGFEIINQCLDVVEAVNFGLYLSADDVLDEGDTLVHSAAIDGAVPGKKVLMVQEKFTVPFNTEPGNYSLFVLADYDELVEESNEGNNANSGPIEVIGICIDDQLEPNNLPFLASDIQLGNHEGLQVCPFDLDWYTIELFEGETISVTATFENAIGDLDLRLYDANNFFVPVVKAFETNDGEQLKFTVEAGQEGFYFIRVNGLSGASNSYDLDVIVEGTDN